MAPADRSATQQVPGVYYPVQAAKDYKGAKPSSAPATLQLRITNEHATLDKVVPLFNLFHQNTRANDLIKAHYVTGKGSAATMAEVIKNYDPENPIADVTVKPVNGKPLAGIYEELKIMPVISNGLLITSDNSNQFNEELSVEYDDFDGSHQSVPYDLSQYKDKYAQDNTEIETDLSFYLDGRGTLFLNIKKNTEVTLKFLTNYHFNRFMFK